MIELLSEAADKSRKNGIRKAKYVGTCDRVRRILAGGPRTFEQLCACMLDTPKHNLRSALAQLCTRIGGVRADGPKNKKVYPLVRPLPSGERTPARYCKPFAELKRDPFSLMRLALEGPRGG